MERTTPALASFPLPSILFSSHLETQHVFVLTRHVISSVWFTLLFSCSLSVTLPMVIDIFLDSIYMNKIPFLPHRTISTLSLFITNLVIIICISFQASSTIILSLFLWSYFVEFSIMFRLLLSLNNYTSHRPIILFLATLSIYTFLWCGQLSITDQLQGYVSTCIAFIGLLTFMGLLYAHTLHYLLHQYYDFEQSKSLIRDWIRGLKEGVVATFILTIGFHVQIFAFVIIFFINRKFSFSQGFFHTSDMEWLIIVRTVLFAFSYFISARLFRNKLIRNNQDLAFKTQLIKYFSHEIRSPIMVISVALELIDDSKRARHIWNPESLQNFIDDNLSDVRSACDQSLEILDAMLLYEKIEAGELEMALRVVEPLEGMRQALRSLSSWAQYCGVGLYMRYSPADLDMLNQRRLRIDDVNLKAVLQAVFASTFKQARAKRIIVPVQELEERLGRPSRLVVDGDSAIAEEFISQEDDYDVNTEVTLRIHVGMMNDAVHVRNAGNSAVPNIYASPESSLNMIPVVSVGSSSSTTLLAMEFNDTSGNITETDIQQMNSRSFDFTRRG